MGRLLDGFMNTQMGPRVGSCGAPVNCQVHVVMAAYDAFIRICLENACHAEQAHPAIWDIVGQDLEQAELTLSVMEQLENMSLTLDLEAFDNALEPRYCGDLIHGSSKVVFIIRNAHAGTTVPDNFIGFFFGKSSL
jgi:hypothetical protein